MLITLQPSETQGSPIVHAGQEFVFVLEGKLAFQIEGIDHELLPGERSCMFLRARIIGLTMENTKLGSYVLVQVYNTMKRGY